MKIIALLVALLAIGCGENPVAEDRQASKTNYWITGTHTFAYTFTSHAPAHEGYARTKMLYEYVEADVNPFYIIITPATQLDVSYNALCFYPEGLGPCRYTTFKLVKQHTAGRLTTFSLLVTIPRYEEVKLAWNISEFEHDDDDD